MLLEGCIISGPAVFDREPMTDRESEVVDRLVERGLMVASEVTRPDPDVDKMEIVADEYITTALGRLVLRVDAAIKDDLLESET
jgi:hypothetical protein